MDDAYKARGSHIIILTWVWIWACKNLSSFCFLFNMPYSSDNHKISQTWSIVHFTTLYQILYFTRYRRAVLNQIWTLKKRQVTTKISVVKDTGCAHKCSDHHNCSKYLLRSCLISVEYLSSIVWLWSFVCQRISDLHLSRQSQKRFR